MDVKDMCRSMALACLAVHSTGYAAQSSANVEFVAAGLEEYVGQRSDQVMLSVYRGDAKEPLHKVVFNPRTPIKKLSLAPAGTYRVSFESNEPDAEGATACSATGALEVAANQQYRVSFTVIKQFCLLSTGSVAADGAYQEIASIDGKMRRLQTNKK